MLQLIRNRGDDLAVIDAALAMLASVAVPGLLDPEDPGDGRLPRVFATDGARLSGCSERGRRTVSGRLICADRGLGMPGGRSIRFRSSGGG
jgi:hypothetical protein